MFQAAMNASSRVALGGVAVRTRPSSKGKAGRARAPIRAAISEPPAQAAADQVPASKGSGRKKVVVLGSGWGAVSFVKSLPADTPYDVVLVSPRNYFLYTPLLPGAATGAVEERSIVEPIRRPISEKGWKYYEAACIDVDASAKKITCRAADPECFDDKGQSCE